jgi:hypothetical protein
MPETLERKQRTESTSSFKHQFLAAAKIVTKEAKQNKCREKSRTTFDRDYWHTTLD